MKYRTIFIKYQKPLLIIYIYIYFCPTNVIVIYFGYIRMLDETMKNDNFIYEKKTKYIELKCIFI